MATVEVTEKIFEPTVKKGIVILDLRAAEPQLAKAGGT